MELSKEQLLERNFSDLSWFQQYNVQLNAETALPYFCSLGNPFYDRTSLNQQVNMGGLSLASIHQATGIEYALIHCQEPILFVIRKQYKDGSNEIRPLQEYYIVAPGYIYQAPDASDVISHRLLAAVYHFGRAFDEASQQAAYHPSSGYYWKSNTSTADDFDRKESTSKDKIVTYQQRYRFDNLFRHYIDRFRPKPQSTITASTTQTAPTTTTIHTTATATTTTTVSTTSTNNNVAATTAVTTTAERQGKEEFNSNNERPMVEIKKQKLQK